MNIKEMSEQELYFDEDEAKQSVDMLRELLEKADKGDIDQHYSVAIQIGIDAILMMVK